LAYPHLQINEQIITRKIQHTLCNAAQTKDYYKYLAQKQVQLDPRPSSDHPLANLPASINKIQTNRMMVLNQVHTQMATAPRPMSCQKSIHQTTMPLVLRHKGNSTSLSAMSAPRMSTSLERP